MKLYIMHKFKTYHSIDQTYAWANAFRSRKDAERAIDAEIESDIDCDMEGSEDCSEDEREEVMRVCKERAWKSGDEYFDAHDAILHYGDFTAYYDITETNITKGE